MYGGTPLKKTSTKRRKGDVFLLPNFNVMSFSYEMLSSISTFRRLDLENLVQIFGRYDKDFNLLSM